MDLFDESETKGDGLRYGDVSAHLRAEMNEQPTPAETINTALCCAEGEAAIEEYEERAAREWLAALVAERDRLRDIARQRDEAEERAARLAMACDEIILKTLHDYAFPNPAYVVATRLASIAQGALNALPAELLAQRERDKAVARAAVAFRDADRAHRTGIFSEGQKERERTLATTLRGLYAAVDGLGEAEEKENH